MIFGNFELKARLMSKNKSEIPRQKENLQKAMPVSARPKPKPKPVTHGVKPGTKPRPTTGTKKD